MNPAGSAALQLVVAIQLDMGVALAGHAHGGSRETGLSSPSSLALAKAGLRLPVSASLSLASCWPLPQQLLPVPAAGGGRRRCSQRERLLHPAKPALFAQGSPLGRADAERLRGQGCWRGGFCFSGLDMVYWKRRTWRLCLRLRRHHGAGGRLGTQRRRWTDAVSRSQKRKGRCAGEGMKKYKDRGECFDGLYQSYQRKHRQGTHLLCHVRQTEPCQKRMAQAAL